MAETKNLQIAPKKTIIFWATIIALGVVSVAGIVYSSIKTIQTIQLSDEINSLQSTNTALNSKNVEIEDQLSTVVPDAIRLQLEKDTAENDSKYTKATLTALENSYFDLRDKSMCNINSKYSFNMVSNSTISESLKELISDTNGSVINSDWETIWTNTNSAIHRLTTKDYLFVFVVSFENSVLGKSDSIYWVDENCFIDLPKK